MQASRIATATFRSFQLGRRSALQVNKTLLRTPATANVQRTAVRSFSATPGSPIGGENLPTPVTSAADLTGLVDASNAIVADNIDSLNFVVRGVMDSIEFIHASGGIPYWEAIILTTIGLRVCLLPIAIKTIQGSARMANMRPDMMKVQEAMQKDPNAGDMNVKLKYQQQMQALFLKHKVNPLRAVMWPFVQFPVFIAFFMALREMGTYFPGMATGGDFWFTDLTAADPYYILPIFNSLSFLAMIELGGDGVNMEQQKKFKLIMRGLAVAMVPLTASMPQGLFVYWGANNVLSIIQTLILKNENLRKTLEIPKMPKPEESPALKVRNPLSALSEAMKNERSKGENAKAEILDGVSAPKAPPSPPPVTFTTRPKKNPSN